MSHTYIANFVHCVFSTKERKAGIPAELQKRPWAYLIGISRNLNIIPIAVGGTSNHVHLLLGVKSTMPIAEAVQKLKANSSRWMGEQGLKFEWQKGYAAFSVSASLVDSVRSYVLNQEEHHRKRTYDEELLALLRKSGITHDPARVFQP